MCMQRAPFRAHRPSKRTTSRARTPAPRPVPSPAVSSSWLSLPIGFFFLIFAHDVRKHQLVGLPVRDVVHTAERIRHRVYGRQPACPNAMPAKLDARRKSSACFFHPSLLPDVTASLPAAQDQLQRLLREQLADRAGVRAEIAPPLRAPSRRWTRSRTPGTAGCSASPAPALPRLRTSKATPDRP